MATISTSTPVAKAAAQKRRRFRLRGETIEGYCFTLPWLIGFLAFSAAPMVISVILIGMNWHLITPPHWVGMANINKMIHDRIFWITVGNTVYIVIFSVPTYLAVSFIFALALNVPLRGINIYRIISYIPSQIPAVANALLWLWIFNPEFGIANALLNHVGLPSQQWFLDPALAKPCLIIMGLWGLGSTIVIFLASLQNVPISLQEAAMIDGANAYRRFWNVTVPMVSPVIFFQLVIGIIGMFQAGFVNTYVITQGGPEYATTVWTLYIYQKGFQDFDMGYAAALSWALFIVVLGFTYVQFRLSRRWVYYEDSALR